MPNNKHAAEMCMERITSKNNKLIKDTRKLFTSSSERRERRLFVLEGARLCFDVLNSVYSVKIVFITENAMNKYPDKSKELINSAESSYIISEEVSKKLSETQNPQGVFAVCNMLEGEARYFDKMLALDNIQDPANLGAILRTAEALGIGGVITYNCCDIYNPKTLRASMGGVLRAQSIATDNLEALLLKLKNEGYKIYSTVPSSNAKAISEIDFDCKAICVIGNEANGVKENIKAASDELITIPMLGNAESLNAGVAAAITMWEMLR